MLNYITIDRAVRTIAYAVKEVETKAMDTLKEIHDIEPIECFDSFHFDRIELDCNVPIAVFVGEEDYDYYRELNESFPLDILFAPVAKEKYFQSIRDRIAKLAEANRVRDLQLSDAKTMKEYDQYQFLKAKFENDSEKSL